MATTEFSVAKPPTGVGLDGVREAARHCRACPLWEPATQTVFGTGPADARVVFVGEQPGDVEDRKGEPFVGPAGKLLDRALVEAGIDRDETYVTNAVKHFRFTQSGKRRLHQTPGPEHVAACRPWLDAELALVNPELVICLGATAAKAMFGPSFRITKQRGQLVPLDQQATLGGEGSLFDEPEDAAVQVRVDHGHDASLRGAAGPRGGAAGGVRRARRRPPHRRLRPGLTAARARPGDRAQARRSEIATPRSASSSAVTGGIDGSAGSSSSGGAPDRPTDASYRRNAGTSATANSTSTTRRSRRPPRRP